MIIQLTKDVSDSQKEELRNILSNIKFAPNEVKTQFTNYWVCIGKGEFDIRQIGSLPYVQDVHRVSDQYKLTSRKWKVGRTQIDLGDGVKIGDGNLSVMAGPCSIENEKQVDAIITHLKANNIKIMRGGVFKPRSSPYAFRGLGVEGLKMFHAKCRQAGIKIISEVMQVSQIAEMIDYVDILQVGARNSQNFNLLDELGKVDNPILLKRGISGSIEELLYSAEYIFSAGNEKIMLCERGIRTYETYYRNTFDINAIPVLKEKTHLPIIADPSHGIGVREHVLPIAVAAVAAGADGLIYEIHPAPEEAFSDAQQTLNFEESEALIKAIKNITS